MPCKVRFSNFKKLQIIYIQQLFSLLKLYIAVLDMFDLSRVVFILYLLVDHLIIQLLIIIAQYVKNMDCIPVVCGNYAYYPNDLIGEGQFSSVYKGFCCAVGPKKGRFVASIGETVAIKALIKSDNNSQMQLKILNDEIKYLSQLKDQENIISLKQVVEDEQKIYLITQYCEGGTLQKYIQKKGKLNDVEAMLFFKQLVKGYEPIYKNHIYHRDIKPENILIKNGILKICDFGFAIAKEQAPKQMFQVGSPMYMPVETLKKNHYSHKGDIWALGITFFQMITGNLPFNAKSTEQLIKQMSFIRIKRLIPKQINPEIVSILQKLLAIKIDQRISYLELKDLLFPPIKKELVIMTPRNLQSQNKKQISFTSKTPRADSSMTFGMGKLSAHQNKLKTLKIQRKQTSDTKSNQESFHIDNKQVKKVLMSQVHLCRLCFKILTRIEKIKIKIISTSLKKEMTQFIFKKLTDVKSMNILAEEIAQNFKHSDQYQILIGVVNSYIKRYAKQLNFKTEVQFNSEQQFIQILGRQIQNIWFILQKLGGLKNNQEIGIVIDFLITLRLLLTMLKKGNIHEFAQHSKIDKIVDGQSHATINEELFKAIERKLKKLKLI